MAISPQTGEPLVAVRDHGFHAVTIRQVVRETAEASSFVLDVPEDLVPGFAYRAGQFLTFRVPHGGGGALLRCYSMSSAPEVDPHLQVTVKRVPGGAVSNWMNDNLRPGHRIEVTYPSGVFCLAPGDGDAVAFAAGSGITPVLSLVKSSLATSGRRLRLLYANRDRDSVIFRAALDELSHGHGSRLDVVHHLDVERGFVDAAAVRPFARGGVTYYICGPAPFMEIVETTLLAEGVDPVHIHVERFSPADAGPPPDAPPDPVPTRVTVLLDGRTGTTEHRPGTTLLQAARQMGLDPPFSCESGNCATCMAKLVEGEVSMRSNNALTPEEVDDHWVLTCQAVPTTESVSVVYGYEEA